ncbi:MAG TPA: ABC transporter substrate-binding protein [Gaiellaceae bacterium]|nr:ABC transporter substrate-binding protein [Gaiellaceae bacterium]
MHRSASVRLRFAAAATSLLVLLFVGPSATAAPRKPPFPVTVTAANGKVTLRHKPHRIVSLSSTATEDLFAIGAGRQVVAVDQFSDYPKRAPRTKLNAITPNVEAIARYRPDLVVVAFDANNVVRALGKLHVPVLLEPAAKNLPGAYAQIRQLGVATGHRGAAATLVAKLRKRIASLLATVPRRAKGRSVYHEISPDHYSATSGTFIGSIYRLFGLQNIADRAGSGSGYPQLSDEYIVAANPELIVLADTTCCGQSAKTVAARPGWGSIEAVKRGAIVPVDDSIAARWGPRITTFVAAIARALRSTP